MDVTQLQSFNFAAFAAAGFVFILSFLFGTYIWWKALAVVKWEKFLFDPFGQNTRLLRFLVATVGGFFLAMVCEGFLLAVKVMQFMF